MKFIVKIIVACLVGFAMMVVAIAFEASDQLALAVYVFGSMAVAIALGAFVGYGAARHMSLKDGARSYGKAA